MSIQDGLKFFDDEYDNVIIRQTTMEPGEHTNVKVIESVVEERETQAGDTYTNWWVGWEGVQEDGSKVYAFQRRDLRNPDFLARAKWQANMFGHDGKLSLLPRVAPSFLGSICTITVSFNDPYYNINLIAVTNRSDKSGELVANEDGLLPEEVLMGSGTGTQDDDIPF